MIAALNGSAAHTSTITMFLKLAPLVEPDITANRSILRHAHRSDPFHVHFLIRYTSWAPPREVNPEAPGRANIYFHLAVAQPARIAITNAAGAPVRTLMVSGMHGINQVTWDLRGDRGTAVSPGAYHIEITAGAARESTPIVVMPATMN